MRLGTHLKNIKRIKTELSEKYQQALQNVDAMHQNCGGKTDDKGNFIMDRESAILWFANNKHKENYISSDV